MGKTATVFKDIGKACNDLLSKDFKVGKTEVEFKSKTPSGVTFTPKAIKSGDKLDGSLAAKYNLMPWLMGEATFGTSGSISANIEAADALSNGVMLSTECERSGSGKMTQGNLIVDCKQEQFTCKASYDYYKSDLLASASTVYGALTCGVDCAYNVQKAAVVKYAAACQLVQPDFTVSSKVSEVKGAKTVSCGYFHNVSKLMQVAVNLSKPLAKPDVDIDFGCLYKLDKDTIVKGKAESTGLLSCSYKQKISAVTTMTLAAQVDVVNLAANKHKFGLQLNLVA